MNWTYPTSCVRGSRSPSGNREVPHPRRVGVTTAGSVDALLRPSRSRAAAAAAAVLLGACSGEVRNAAWTTTTDTLDYGVIHVVNTPPAAVGEAATTLVEELRIGSVEGGGAETFGQLKGLAVLRDGRIVVLDAHAQELRVFGREGEHLASFGGKGAGPGELEGAWGLMRDADDLLWVPDFRNDRMSVFHPVQGFLRSYPLPVYSRGFVWDGVLTHDGRIVKPSIIPHVERSYLLRVYDRTMTLVDSIGLPAPPRVNPEDLPHAFYWEAPGGIPYGTIGVPFYPWPHTLLDPRGGVWSAGRGDPSYRITYATFQGDTALVLETERPPVPVTDAERSSALTSVQQQLAEAGAPARQDWSKIPAVHPAVNGLLLTEEGRLWARTRTSEAGGSNYDIYERDGRYAATVATQLDLVSYVAPVIRGDTVWAVVTDELDVPYVVRARLVVPAAPAR